MPDEVSPILELKNVSLQYGDVWALSDVCLTLMPGETRIIFGAAGSGKTTLLKSIIGLVAVDKGYINLFGHDVTLLTEHQLFPLRSRAGILFQEGGLFDSLTIGENVEYPLVNQQASGVAKNGNAFQDTEARVRESLRFVELEQTFNKFPSELSGGMRRRVGIARAIVTEPPLVLYDSPTAGLDPITANLIMALIAKERDVKNTASLIVTHRYQDGELMSDFKYNPERQELVRLDKQEQENDHSRTKFLVMREGKIVFSGSRHELESSADDYLKRFVRHEEKNAE